LDRGGRRALRWNPALLLAALSLSLVLTGCRLDTLTEPLPDGGLPNLLVRPVSGDHQVGLVGSVLPEPLVVEVVDLDAREPRAGVAVVWEVVRGDGAVLDSEEVITDGSGRAANRLSLGSGAERYLVRATVGGEDPRWSDFEATAIEAMVLNSLSAESATPGEVIGLLGTGFLAASDSNVVLFSGLRARVLSATPTRLDVEVPACLPERSVAVTVGLGWVRSSSRSLSVVNAGTPLILEVGDDVVLPGGGSTACLRIGSPGEYALVVQSPVSVAERLFPFRLTGIRGDVTGPLPAAGPALSPESSARRGSGGPSVRGSTQPTGRIRGSGTWESTVRSWERELIRTTGLAPGGGERGTLGIARAEAAFAPPEVGELRDFQVLSREGTFDPVTARARWVGANVAVYVDTAAPAPGLGDSDVTELGDAFDDPVFSVVSGSFGAPSDLDGNERVVVLLTPRVNALSRSPEDGIVGGFFYAGDLLPAQVGSNAGEVFYALVPDPDGTLGFPITVEEVKLGVPAVMAHELQHMIHFNRRVLEAGAVAGETLWLSEGLAHLAEQLVADTLSARGLPQEAALYSRANLLRGQEYMDSVGSVSALQDTGDGTLAERGGAWLFVRYLEEHFRTESILERLTTSTLSGEQNVAAATRLPFSDPFSGWSAALQTDGTAPLDDPLLEYPDTDIRALFDPVPGGYTLSPIDLGEGEWDQPGSIPGGGSAYFEFRVPSGNLQGTALGIGRTDGGPTEESGQVRIRLVRTS
jgi:hypothetical protein